MEDNNSIHRVKTGGKWKKAYGIQVGEVVYPVAKFVPDQRLLVDHENMIFKAMIHK